MSLVAVLVLLVCAVGFAVALVGAVAGLGSIGLSETELVSADLGATLGVASIACALVAIPIGILGWRWAERRRERSGLGQAAGLIGGTTLLAWFAVLFYALSQDTP